MEDNRVLSADKAFILVEQLIVSARGPQNKCVVKPQFIYLYQTFKLVKHGCN